MEQQTKYIDSKKVLANKEKISATIPLYIYDWLIAFSDLTDEKISDIVTTALFEFFRDKTVTNDYLLGAGKLYFNLPLSKEFKENAIANQIKLNQYREIIEPNEQITIKTVTNNLDIFNGVSYFAGEEFSEENINHIGLDFAIIPTAIEPTNTIKFDKLDIALTDCLYVFYYEVSSNKKIDVYLINPIEAINRLSAVNENKTSQMLIECLQDLENFQKEINKNYSDEMQELHDNNQYVSNEKEIAIKDKYTAIFLEVLNDIAIKYDNPNIKIGSDSFKYNLEEVYQRINELKNDSEITQRIIEYQKKFD